MYRDIPILLNRIDTLIYRMDATPCGRGWVGTKPPGCKRAKAVGAPPQQQKAVKPSPAKAEVPATKGKKKPKGADTQLKQEVKQEIQKAKAKTEGEDPLDLLDLLGDDEPQQTPKPSQSGAHKPSKTVGDYVSNMGKSRPGESAVDRLNREKEERKELVNTLVKKAESVKEPDRPKKWGRVSKSEEEDFFAAIAASKENHYNMMLTNNKLRDMKKAAADNGISLAEASAVHIYTASAYFEMNRQLRGQENIPSVDTRASMLTAKVAASALDKMPPYEGTVYRGFGLRDGMTIDDIKKQYKPGSTIQEKGFLSTTNDDNPDNAFSRKEVRFVINSKTGRNVAGLSNSPDEKEILFKPDTKLKVLRHEEKDGKLFIYMDEP